MFKSNTHLIILLSSALITASSCSDTEVPSKTDDGQKTVKKELLDPNRSFNTAFDGKLFSVPSPIQTALLIKSTKLPYNEDLLNTESNVSKYTSSTSQALNLGIYGADLGYATLYEQNAKALKYINVIESLSNSLGITGAFDANFLNRFEANSTNQDSMLVILSDAFRKGDSFLKENERKNTSALILTGGWIESMYFAANLYAKSKDMKILNRIGEQKQSLETIIEILTDYNKEGKNDELLASLEELNTLFQQIIITHEYVEPITDVDNRMTTIRNKMNISISDELATKIINHVNELRASIVA